MLLCSGNDCACRALRIDVHVVHHDEIALQAAKLLSTMCKEAVKQRGVFTLALSGGSTPVPLFRLLRRPEWLQQMLWDRTRVFWADERCVGPKHPSSNYGVATQELLDHVRADAVYRMHGEAEPEAEAKAYSQTLCKAVHAGKRGIPRFDCILLGMGEDGHTASLFPGNQLLAKTRGELVIAVKAAHLGNCPESRRITLNFPVLNEARCCMFIVAGAAKRKALRTALDLLAPPYLPVQCIRPRQGKLIWIVDEEAARS